MSAYRPCDEIVRRRFVKRVGDQGCEGQECILTVAVVGGCRDFAAYEGIGAQNAVSRFGVKMSENEARRLFPDLAELDYRP